MRWPWLSKRGFAVRFAALVEESLSDSSPPTATVPGGLNDLLQPAHTIHTDGRTFAIWAEEDEGGGLVGCFAEIVDGKRSPTMWHRTRRRFPIHEDACREAFYLIVLDVRYGWDPAYERERLKEGVGG